MPRLPRIALGGHAHHVVQHGHDGQPIVRDDEDRLRWLDLLRDAAATQRVDLHAWLLLDDHFHLVLTPAEPGALSRLMQGLTRRHAAAYNRRHGRRGTLWEGRFRASLVQAGAWLGDVLLYVEQHPVRAGLVAEAADWPWSSARHHRGLLRDPGLAEAGAWWALGNTPFDREAAWQRRLTEGLPAARLERITAATRRGWPIGDPDFLALLQAETPLPLAPRPRGRPPRAPGVNGPAGEGADQG
jgi:putative transposase